MTAPPIMAFVLPPVSQGRLSASSSLLSSSSGGDDLFDSSDAHPPAHSDAHPPTHSDSSCLSHCPQIRCQHQSYMSFLAFKMIKIGLTRTAILKLRNLTCLRCARINGWKNFASTLDSHILATKRRDVSGL
ncbi:hypothetical protein ARMGADRAFT_668385 [Armillaria gallica]|uniref:Uncharacterized protein n=1 Tax=Armillaria gallica TaxID=47427 RepID=A0A2H3D3Y6_ARMGA|nr:hypothetical protein ARMGADRAFT_668582 [Armillaria gallica]PBK83757.1 hypothetical protein ARMGADRAFT_668385 [Armillaria gallica]